MYIRTFTGSDDDMDNAVEEAETAAQQALNNIGAGELISVQAQSLIDRWRDGSENRHTCFHIITVTYE